MMTLRPAWTLSGLMLSSLMMRSYAGLMNAKQNGQTQGQLNLRTEYQNHT